MRLYCGESRGMNEIWGDAAISGEEGKGYSVRGCRTNPRSNMDAWGIVSFSSFKMRCPYSRMSKSNDLGPFRIEGNRPRFVSIRFRVRRRPCGGRAVLAFR